MSMQVNKLPVLTWNRLQLNAATLDASALTDSGRKSALSKVADLVGVSREKEVPAEKLYARFEKLGLQAPAEQVVAGKSPIVCEQRFQTGMGKEIDALMEQTPADIYTVEGSYESDTPVRLHYSYGLRCNLPASLYIPAGGLCLCGGMR